MSGELGKDQACTGANVPFAPSPPEVSNRPPARSGADSPGEFLSGMSPGLAHDLQSLLTPISTCLQLLKTAPEKAVELAPVALKNLETVQDYVRQGRWQSEHNSPCIQWVPFDLLLERAVGLMENRLAGREVSVQVQGGGGLLVQVDRVLILRLIVNLLANAVAASPSGTTIMIDTEVQLARDGSRWVAFEVRDQGTGFRDETSPKSQPADGSEAAGEHGLGLVVCERILALHGGRMSVRRGKSGGTVVRVDLPVEQGKAG